MPKHSSVYSILFTVSLISTLFLIFCEDPVEPVYPATIPNGQIYTLGTLSIDSAFSMFVITQGSKPITFKWLKNGLDIPGAIKDTLSIPSLRISDTGIYHCVAANNRGMDTSNAYHLTFNNYPPQWVSDTMYDTTYEGLAYSIILADSCTDPDGNPILFSLLAGGPVGDTIDSLQQYRFTPSYDAAGEYLVSFSADDRYNLSYAILKLTVLNTNRKPLYDTLQPDTLYTINEGGLLVIPLKATDPDLDTVIYHIEGATLPRPQSITLTNDTLRWQSLPGDSSAQYTLVACACDLLDTTKALVKVSVLDIDYSPTLDTLKDTTITESNILSFLVKAADPDKDTITLTTSFTNPGATFIDSGNGVGLFTWNTGYDDSGSHTLTFIAQSTTLADTVAVTISVQDKPHQWTINAGAGVGGTILPTGFIKVFHGLDTGFTIAPASSDYRIKDVKVNGASVGAVTTYRFTSVKGDSTIFAEFMDNSMPLAVAQCKDSTVGLNDTIHCIGSASNDADGTIVKYEWKIGASAWTKTSTSDTTFLAPATPTAALICSLRVTDNDNKTNSAMVAVVVQSSPPTALAKSDTAAVGLNDPFHLIGSGSTDNGTITAYAWKIGAAPWVVCATGDTALLAPPTAQTLLCSLRVTDDDNEIGLGVVSIAVNSSPPLALAQSDTNEIGLNDTFNLIGSGSSDNGTITAYAWKIGASSWTNSATGDTTIIAPAIAQTLICSLWVIDDDKEESKSAVSIPVKSAPPLAVAKADTLVKSINDQITLTGSGSSDSNGAIIRYEWKIGTGPWTVSTTGDTTFTGPPTFGVLPCSLRVTDDDNEVGIAAVSINVISMPPTAVAQADTNAVSINDQITLIGSGSSDSNGSIAKYAWKINNGAWIISATGDTTFMGPATVQTLVCSLKVTDDDGEISVARIDVEVMSMPPVPAVTSNKVKIVIGDSISLSPQGSYDNGTIVKYEWKIGNAAFLETSNSDTTIFTPTTEQTLLCVLRLTDDDNEIAYGEVSIEIVKAFTLVGDSAAFSNRTTYSTAVFNNKMWVIGGRIATGSKEYKNDVWSSSDGITWSKVIENASFSRRGLHTSTVFNNKLWVVGGYDSTQYLNDVWSSADGYTWSLATANASFTPRYNHKCIALNGKMWLIAGSNLSDVWSSSDGITWEEVADTAEFKKRNPFNAAVLNSKMWIIGGKQNAFADVWNSTDGKYWLEVGDQSILGFRAGLGCVVLDNKFWIFGGSNPGGYMRDLRYSEDGNNWIRVTNNAHYPAYGVGHFCLAFNNKIWLFYAHKIYCSSDAILP